MSLTEALCSVLVNLQDDVAQRHGRVGRIAAEVEHQLALRDGYARHVDGFHGHILVGGHGGRQFEEGILVVIGLAELVGEGRQFNAGVHDDAEVIAFAGREGQVVRGQGELVLPLVGRGFREGQRVGRAVQAVRRVGDL